MSLQRVKRKKKRKIKRRLRRILSVIVILLIVCMGYKGYKGVKKIFTIAIDKNEKKLQEKVYINKIPKEVMDSNDPIIQSLTQTSKDYPKVGIILNNLSSYPNELLELASKKAEAIDFVVNYLNYKAHPNKKISIKEDYEKGKIPLFVQWDKRWGYEKYGSNFIATNGCGPTALAMVAVGLTGNTDINPKVVADFSSENGYLVDGEGSSWNLMTEGAKEFGIKSRELPLSKSVILNTLEKGQPIIVSMGPGTFTTTGHYIVLTGVDSNDNIIINDSDSKERSKQTWDINVFMKETKNLWAFTPIDVYY